MRQLVIPAAALLLVACAVHRETSALARQAAAGDAQAQYAYGVTLLVTEQGKLNRPRAAYPWLMKAAQQGLPNAQALVGLCLQRGWGVEPNEQQAVEWYKKAIHQGQSGAAMQLAELSASHAAPEAAGAWLEEALAKGPGTPEAHLMLATLYLRQGLPTKAVRHLRYAALDGNAEAAYRMASCYEEGVGVPRDTRLMIGWLTNAADLGYKPAKARLEELLRSTLPQPAPAAP